MKNILLIFLLVPLFIFSQKEESKESKLHRYWAQQERKKSLEDSVNKNFYLKNEISFYIKGEKIGEFQMPTYHSMVRSCNDVIKLEKNDTIIKKYYDTLNFIQEQMEIKGFLDKINYKSRVTWYLRGTKPNRIKVDSIIMSEIYKNSKIDNDVLMLYYNNLYFLFNESKKYTYLDRIYIEHMEYINKDSVSEPNFTYLNDIFNKVYRDSTVFSNLETNFTNDSIKNSKKLNFIVSFMEVNGFTETNFYKNTLENIVKIDPTVENYFKIANYHKKQGDEVTYNRYITQIKDKFPQFKDEFNYNECVLLFNSGKYRQAYDFSFKIGGKYKGESLKIAAMSVSALANQSGITTFERKCNYYYAIQLLEKAKQHNTPVSTLISQYKTCLPTMEEKFEEGNPKTINLSTWGVVISIN